MDRQRHVDGAPLTPTALLDILARLQDCLERETDSLVQPGAPDLDRIVVEKARYLEALTSFDRAVGAFATRQDAGGRDVEMVPRWLASQGITDQTMAGQLQLALETCQRLNQRNGAVLIARGRQVAFQLQVLGVSPVAPLYAADGSVVAAGRGRLTDGLA